MTVFNPTNLGKRVWGALKPISKPKTPPPARNANNSEPPQPTRWKEENATASEAMVKADRSQEAKKSIEELQTDTVEKLKGKA
ncbi:hypothetical protein HDU78_006162 [Chytriomyces hyalinus]|nr:hypothetical protein HDU78_006162 [Chytriomyces hyalinus]KAJ3250360.1 hypothetical protein HDU77_006736 [Chytriomyces hyalinus]